MVSTSAKLSVNSVEPLVVSLSNYPQSDIRHYFFSLPLLFTSYFLLLSSYSLLPTPSVLSNSTFAIRHSQFNFCGEHFGKAQCKLRRTTCGELVETLVVSIAEPSNIFFLPFFQSFILPFFLFSFFTFYFLLFTFYSSSFSPLLPVCPVSIALSL